jgi:hypothetical protein
VNKYRHVVLHECTYRVKLLPLNSRSERKNHERDLYDGKSPKEQVHPTLQRGQVMVDWACSKEGQLK